MSDRWPALAGPDHLDAVLRRLEWMDAQRVWPGGLRYLWTDATRQDHFLDRVESLLGHFDTYRSGDHYDRDAITHVMGCVARLPGAFL